MPPAKMNMTALSTAAIHLVPVSVSRIFPYHVVDQRIPDEMFPYGLRGSDESLIQLCFVLYHRTYIRQVEVIKNQAEPAVRAEVRRQRECPAL